MVNKLFQMFIYQFSALVFVMTKKIGSNFSYIFSNLLSLTFSVTCRVKFIKVRYHYKSSTLFAQSGTKKNCLVNLQNIRICHP